MKKLQELYEKTQNDVIIKGIKINSKEIEKGDLFICTKVERQAFEWIQIAFREEKKKNVIHCQLLNLVYPSLN